MAFVVVLIFVCGSMCRGERAGCSSPTAPITAPRFSHEITEVLKLVDAKVDRTVILAFISSLPVRYQLDPTNRDTLRNRGVPEEYLFTIWLHDRELSTSAPAHIAPTAASTPNLPTPPTVSHLVSRSNPKAHENPDPDLTLHGEKANVSVHEGKAALDGFGDPRVRESLEVLAALLTIIAAVLQILPRLCRN